MPKVLHNNRSARRLGVKHMFKYIAWIRTGAQLLIYSSVCRIGHSRRSSIYMVQFFTESVRILINYIRRIFGTISPPYGQGQSIWTHKDPADVWRVVEHQ